MSSFVVMNRPTHECTGAHVGRRVPPCMRTSLAYLPALRVLQCFSRRGVLSFQQMPVPIDHLYGPPAGSIHDLAYACSTLEKRRGGMLSQIVQPHSRHARFRARSNEGPRDRVRVVRPLARRVGRENVGRRLDPGAAPLGSHQIASCGPSRVSSFSDLWRCDGCHPSSFP